MAGADSPPALAQGGVVQHPPQRSESHDPHKGACAGAVAPSPLGHPDPARAASLVLFAGGGTGGHIFPSIAIAECIADRLGPKVAFRFLCSSRPIDAEILRECGADHVPAPANPPGLRPRALVRFLGGWGPSVRLGREAIRAGRRAGQSVVMVASGGFVAAPLVQAARVERCPVVMLNLDAVPGRANRWIARHAARIFTTAPVADPPQRGAPWEPIPPIVRRSALPPGSAGDCRAALGLDPGTPTLLVTGGSQGASSINGFLSVFAAESPSAMRGWQVIHQTGRIREEDERAVRRGYEAAGVRALVRPFLSTMGVAWGAADVCVCRAGAGNVAESWATGTPCLFMPYPYHSDNHQRANAMPLVEAGAAVLAHDVVDTRANMEEAGAALAELLTSAPLRDRLRAALAGLGPASGAASVAREVVRVLAPE